MPSPALDACDCSKARLEALRARRGLGGLSPANVRKNVLVVTPRHARLSRCDALLFPQLADRGELRGEHRELAFDGGELLLVGRRAPRFLGALERFARLCLV